MQKVGQMPSLYCSELKFDTQPDKYFRVGHMGASVVDKSRGDIDRVISGIKEALVEAKAEKRLS